jgi:hypothetical protein
MAVRHDDADTSLVSVERSDVIDAAAGLQELARKTRREAQSRRYGGVGWASTRAGMRRAAEVYEAAAARMQRAADEALR